MNSKKYQTITARAACGCLTEEVLGPTEKEDVWVPCEPCLAAFNRRLRRWLGLLPLNTEIVSPSEH